jgi:hypothetical protein
MSTGKGFFNIFLAWSNKNLFIGSERKLIDNVPSELSVIAALRNKNFDPSISDD